MSAEAFSEAPEARRRPPRRPVGATVLALARASHPLPSAAVTTIAVAYAATAGASPARLLLLGGAVLTGQLGIGWSNDAIDAAKDRAAGRLDKPIASGQVRRTLVGRASAVTTILTIALSIGLGATAAVLHLVAVALGHGYNARLKTTLLSPVPYLVAFGLLPVVAWIAAGAGGLPPAAHIVAAVLLGAAAHAGNTVADVKADALTGVRGLPQRIGPEGSMLAMAILVAAAAAVLLIAMVVPGLAGGGEPAQGAQRAVAFVLLIAGALLACVGAAGARGTSGEAPSSVRKRGASSVGPTSRIPPFALTLAAVGLVVAGFLLGA